LLEIALLCAGCHGMAGEGRAEVGYPRIHGQPRAYLERQLDAYADGRRQSIVMAPLAKRLGADERAALAAHFANIDLPVEASAIPIASERGQALATVGDNRLRVQACQNCHGPEGMGQPPFGAALAGLDAAYLEAQLRAWREEVRKTDPSNAMTTIARNLPQDDMAAVAAYYASLRPLRLRGEPLHPSRPVPAIPSSSGGTAATGRGVEGGAATQEGAQGPGGGPTR
jgi:cytochrome c553